MDTEQLRGSVGTPDDPLLPYEEAVRQRGTDRDLVLWVGQDIIPAGEDEFPKSMRSSFPDYHPMCCREDGMPWDGRGPS